jgi:excisionase family DNA binding protein
MEPFVGIEEAARFLGVKRSWMYEQCRLNKLPSHKVGPFRRFRLSELEAWAQADKKSVPQA